MSNFSKLMKEARLFRAESVPIFNDYQAKMKGIDKYRGSSEYDKLSASYEGEFSQKRSGLIAKYRSNMIPIINQMRTDVSNNLTAPPSTEAVNTLTLLRQLKNLSKEEFTLYMERWGDNPLVAKVLSEIAFDRKIKWSNTDDNIADKLQAVDRLENAMGNYLNGFKADGNMLTSIQMIDCAMHDDDFYRAAKDGSTVVSEEDVFLDRVVHADRSDFEPVTSPGGTQTFEDGRDLWNEVYQACKDQPSETRGIIRDEILSNYPDNYRAAYYAYENHQEIVKLTD